MKNRLRSNRVTRPTTTSARFTSRYSDAAHSFDLAVQMNNLDSERWHSLAAAYQWSNQAEKARAAFKRTTELAEAQLRVNPRDTDALITLGDAYSMLNRSQRSRQLLEKALALAPDDVQNIFQASVVYKQLGDRK
jgi:tetratricopeptide (TPR) repeat protein